MSYNRDVTGLQSTLAMIERIRSPQQLQQIAQQYQNKPNGGAIIAAALAQAQKLKELQSGMAPSNNAGQNTAPVADEAINSIDPRALPEDTGIARIPAPNIANMAEGGIVAFAGGGYNDLGDEGRLQILAQEMRQARQRLVQGDARAQGDIDALTREIGRIKKTPSIAAKVASALLPMGAAQAEALPPPATSAPIAPAATPSIYTGPGYTPEGLEELGQRLDVIREARSKAKPPTLRERQADPEAAKRYQALQDLNLQSQREYEKYAENIYNKPAFAAPSAGGKGVGATTLPAAQKVAKEAAAEDIQRQAADRARREGAETPAATDTGEYQGKSGDPDVDIGPKQQAELPMSEKKMVGLAKEAIPASERKGWTDDMLMQFFLSMMAGQSPNALANIGAAGLGALKYGQEAKKAELEREKDLQTIALGKAHEKYYGAAAQRYEAEDKPLAQYTKAVDAALAKLAQDPMYSMKTPAEKAALEAEVRKRVALTYIPVYPELADTIIGKTGNPLVDKYSR